MVRYIWGHTLSTDLWGAFFTFFLALETHLDPLLAFKYVQEGGTALAGRTEHGAPTNPSPQLVIPYRTASRPYCIFRVRMDDDRSAYVRYTGGNESAAVYPRRTATKSCFEKENKKWHCDTPLHVFCKPNSIPLYIHVVISKTSSLIYHHQHAKRF